MTRSAEAVHSVLAADTLVVDGRLFAVDWDAASLRCVVREAVTVALDWSRDPEEFRRVLDAYGEASGCSLPTDAWVFGGWVSALGGWLAYNATTRGESDTGRTEVSATCDRLLALWRSLASYEAALARPHHVHGPPHGMRPR